MGKFRRNGVLLLAGVVALVPVVVLCSRFCRSRGWLWKSNGNETDDGDDTTDRILFREEEREKYRASLHLLKERANAHFQAGEFDDALVLYQSCSDICAALGPRDAEALRVGQTVGANTTLVLLRLQRPEESRMLATFLLQDETHPVEGDLKAKVLYRRGMASRALGDHHAALCDFRAAVHFSPGGKNPAAEKAIAELSRS